MKLVLCFCVLLFSCKAGAEELDQLVTDFFDWRLDNAPEFGTKFGINNHDDKLEQYTEEVFDKQKMEAEEFLEKANGMSTDSLDLQDKISLAILKDLLSSFIDGYKFREYSIYNGVAPLEHPIREWKSLISWSKFNTVTDYTNYLARLDLLPQQLTQKQALMQKAIAKGYTQPKEALTGVVETTQEEINKAVEEGAFYAPFKTIPDTIDAEERTQLQNQAKDAIEKKVYPAFQGFITFMTDTYTPAARPELGATTLPGGEEYYEACLRWHLSVTMTPQEIHDLGVQEVERITGEMEKIMNQSNFEGSLQEYKTKLEDDPDNFFDTSDELLQGFKDFINDPHAKLSSIMNNVPQMALSVQSSDNPYGATGRYTEPPLDDSRPGIFYANVFNPDEKPKFNIYALALHEAEPGHHTQTAVTVENKVANFRRAIEYRKYNAVPFNWLFHTAYSEGWALYAEALGEDMGAYTEPHAMFGRYASEILRAARLVVDTGIHAFGWSHEKAVGYLADTTTLSQSSCVNEINRYIAWPGQACAYKIGELKIRELKERAKEKLGDKFDQKDFHDQVLLLGNAPLHVLEDHINNWIGVDDEVTDNAAILNVASWVTIVCMLLCRTFA